MPVKRRTKNLSLELLREQERRIMVENSHRAAFNVKGTRCNLFLEPDGVLHVRTRSLPEKVATDLSAPSLTALLTHQAAIGCPVKFTLNRQRRMQLQGDLPLSGPDSLTRGFRILKAGMLQGTAIVKSVVRGKSGAVARGVVAPESGVELPPEEIFHEQIEEVLLNGYEYTRRDSSDWTVSYNTRSFYQRIGLEVAYSAQYLRVYTSLCIVTGEDVAALRATSLFLLHSAARLRFMRAFIAPLENEKHQFGLEAVVPLVYLSSFKVTRAIEGLKTATHITRLPCEALQLPGVAETYLHMTWKLNPENTNP